MFDVPGPAANGTVVIRADGASLTYTAIVGFEGTDTFTYTVSDGSGGTQPGTVTVAVKDPLTAADGAVQALTGVGGGVKRSLDAKLDAIVALRQKGERAGACLQLRDFVSQVNDLPQKQLSTDQKAMLLELAGLIGHEHCGS